MSQDRLIVIDATGQIKLVGVWRVGELLGAANALGSMANNVLVTIAPQPEPIQPTPTAE